MNTNEHLQAAIEQLRAERDQRDQAIRAIETLLGLEHGGPNGASAPQVRGRKAKAVHTEPSAADETSDRILMALRTHGPLSPAELKKRAKISDYLLNSRLKQLGSRVVVTGSTHDRMIALPGRQAKEEP